MKRLALIIISLLSALTISGSVAAYAETGNTIYPQNEDFIKSLSFTSLGDYAVNGDVYAFAEGGNVYVYDGGNLSEYSFDLKIVKLDCGDGVFFYQDSEENVFSLPDGEECEREFQSAREDLNIGSYLYYFDDLGALTVYNKTTKNAKTFEGNFTNLKLFGETVYAINGNELYSFDGERSEKINLSYADYSSTQTILIGQAKSSLKDYSLKFVTVDSGAYMTVVDLTSIEDEYFITGKTVKANENVTALLLCYTGNAALIAIGDVSYILLKDATHETTVKCYTEKPFDNATITGNTIYASPYVIIGTSSMPNAAGTIVKILNKLEYSGVLGSAFYEVEYAVSEGVTAVGYVADGFLTEYIIEDNKQPTEIPDPEYSEQTDTRKVLLIFAVVILVLAAIGYIAYVGTSGKQKKSGKKDSPTDGKDNK